MARLVGLVLVAATCGMTTVRSQAREVDNPSYRELFSRAELVLVAKAVSTVDAAGKGAGADRNWHRVAVLTTFDCIYVIKGKHQNKNLVLFHYRWRDDEWKMKVRNPPRYVRFDTGGKLDESGSAQTAYMLFLKKGDDGRYECVTGPTDPVFSVKKITALRE